MLKQDELKMDLAMELYLRGDQIIVQQFEIMKLQGKLDKIRQLYDVTGDFETVYHSVWDIVNG